MRGCFVLIHGYRIAPTLKLPVLQLRRWRLQMQLLLLMQVLQERGRRSGLKHKVEVALAWRRKRVNRYVNTGWQSAGMAISPEQARAGRGTLAMAA